MNDNFLSFSKRISNRFFFTQFLLAKLPAAYFAGLKIEAFDEGKAVVSVKEKWFNKNPFHSIYFAVLTMAAEMSTGALAMAHLYKRKPAVSMLVIKVESEYFKKATGITTFVCEDGEMIKNAIEESIATGESRIVRARSIGKNKDGEIVAEFFIIWSFKAKLPFPKGE